MTNKARGRPASLFVSRRIRPIPDVVNKIYVPLPVIDATDEVMKAFRHEQRECYVWWGGFFSSDGTAQVITALCPDLETDFGRIHLGLKDFATLHSRLRDLDQVLIAELHSHPPGAGGQNEVDASNPAAPYPGFISVVVPDFAFPHFADLRNTYVYEYLEKNK